MGLLTEEDRADFREAVALMRELGVKRLKNADIDIELFDTAPARPAVALKDLVEQVLADESRACVCGHDLDVEHNEHGCLFTCSPMLCNTRKDAPPKE